MDMVAALMRVAVKEDDVAKFLAAGRMVQQLSIWRQVVHLSAHFRQGTDRGWEPSLVNDGR